MKAIPIFIGVSIVAASAPANACAYQPWGIRFEPGSAKLSAETKASLNLYVDTFTKWPRDFPNGRMILALTMDRQLTREQNLKLFDMRVRTARTYMVARGVPAWRVGGQLVKTVAAQLSLTDLPRERFTGSLIFDEGGCLN